MMKLRLYISLLLTLLLSSCELYMDQLDAPETTDDAPDPKKELVTEEYEGAKVSYSYTESTVELSTKYDQYIISSTNDSIFYFREDTPNSFLPKPGDVLFSKMRVMYPLGLARKVNEVKKENGMYSVYTEKAAYTDVFTDLNLDLTNYEYPTYEFVNYANQTGPTIRKASVSRDPGDVTEIDGVKFTCVSRWQLHFTDNREFALPKNLGINIDGELVLTVEKFEGIQKDETDIFEGKMVRESISITRCILSGKATFTMDFTWKPFQDMMDAAAAASSVEGVLIGHVFYPDITLTIAAGAELDGTFTKTTVERTDFRINNFHVDDRDVMKKVINKYGAGETRTGNIIGTLSLTINIELRVGLAVAGGTIEKGAYFTVPIKFSLNIDADPNAKELTIPYNDRTRTFRPRSNSNIKFRVELADVGLYIRLGLPYGGEAALNKFTKKFIAGYSFKGSLTDLFKAKINLARAECIIYINFLAIAKWIFKFNPVYETKWPFYPELNSKKSYFVCANVKDFDRTTNHIQGKLYFKESGLGKYQNLELAVYDNQDQYVMTVPCDDDGEIVVKKNDKLYAYSFDMQIPIIWGAENESNYYNIYPCYRVRQTFTNPGADPEDMFWGFYCDQGIKVKNYRPCANLKKTHQNMYYVDDSGSYPVHYYGVRTYSQIMSTPEIKEWGMLVYYYKDKKSITESNVKKFTKVGTYKLQPDPDGTRSYLDSEGTTSIDFEIAAKRKSLEFNCLYIVPFYKDPKKEVATILYDDGVVITLKDNDDLQNIYNSDFDEVADQSF